MIQRWKSLSFMLAGNKNHIQNPFQYSYLRKFALSVRIPKIGMSHPHAILYSNKTIYCCYYLELFISQYFPSGINESEVKKICRLFCYKN